MSDEIEREAYQELINAIDNLPLREQICLFMHSYLDVSVDSISRILQVEKTLVIESIESAKRIICVYIGNIHDEQVRSHCIVKLPFLMDIYANELKNVEK